MKTIVFGLIFIAICLFFYNQQHPFGRSSIPDGHEYAADGIYFLRIAYTVPAPTGPVQWKQGQQVFADRLAKTSAPKGTRLVTDGTHSAPVPTNMLSEDVQEGQALRQVEIDALARARAEKETQDRASALAAAKADSERQRMEQARLLAAQVQKPAPTPMFGHTALDQQPARGYWYSGRYYYYPTPTP